MTLADKMRQKKSFLNALGTVADIVKFAWRSATKRFKGINTPSVKRQLWSFDACHDVWEWICYPFWSVTMHSNGTLPLLLSLDVPLDARCGYSLNVHCRRWHCLAPPSHPRHNLLTPKKRRYFYHKIVRLSHHHFAYLSNYSLVATFKETMSENHYKPGCRHTWGLGNQLFLFGSEAGNQFCLFAFFLHK